MSINLMAHGLRRKDQVINQTEYVEIDRKTASEVYNETNILEIPLQELKKKRIAKLSEECTAAIHAGFISNKTGFGFGFNARDQDNFTRQYLVVVSGDNAGNMISWKSTSHGVVSLSEEDFRSVVLEAGAHQMSQQKKYWLLESKILAADTNEKVHAVIWG